MFFYAVKRKVEDVGISRTFFGKTIIYELYPGAFETRFRGQWTCIYKFNEKDFKIETEPHEVVSDHAVRPVECEFIEDCEKYLINMEKKGQVIIKRYNDYTPKDKERCKTQLKQQIKESLKFKPISNDEYNLLSQQEKISYDSIKERYENNIAKFPELVDEIEKENN